MMQPTETRNSYLSNIITLFFYRLHSQIRSHSLTQSHMKDNDMRNLAGFLLTSFLSLVLEVTLPPVNFLFPWHNFFVNIHVFVLYVILILFRPAPHLKFCYAILIGWFTCFVIHYYKCKLFPWCSQQRPETLTFQISLPWFFLSFTFTETFTFTHAITHEG
jgi:NADH:ubiquinone oxidoreductase subunit 3 (subunit A)